MPMVREAVHKTSAKRSNCIDHKHLVPYIQQSQQAADKQDKAKLFKVVIANRDSLGSLPVVLLRCEPSFHDDHARKRGGINKGPDGSTFRRPRKAWAMGQAGERVDEGLRGG